jgi:lysophospholipase L1-like esterase
LISITLLPLGEADRGARQRWPGLPDLGLDSTGKTAMNAARMNNKDVNRPGSSRLLLILGLVACLPAAVFFADRAPNRSGCGASAFKSVPVAISWAMAERFGPGYDRNHDGLPDLPNSPEYVDPGRFEVRLAVGVDGSSSQRAGMFSVWTIDGLDQAIRLRASGPEPLVRLPQGNYAVSVTVRLADGRIGSAWETIRVKDILVVALGDSLATGEGNPEVPARWQGAESQARGWVLRGRLDPSVPARWADGGPDGDQPRVTPAGMLPPVNDLHARAHRSTRSGAAQFAMRLEAEDPHTSVTFVCLAATGARADDLFSPYRPDPNRALEPGPALPAQLDELHAITGSRSADILILALGMNDSRTFELLGELLRREIRCIDPLRLLAAYPTRDDWEAARRPDIEAFVDPKELARLKCLGPDDRRLLLGKDADLIYDVAAGALAGQAAARNQLERLTRVIAKDPLFASAEVCLLEYPDPSGDADGATAGAILDELVPGCRVNRRELDLARERMLQPLNKTLREAADRQGWTYVGGIAASFRSRGYRAQRTWIIRAKEAEELQGPRLSTVGYLRGQISPGTLHPNRSGHQAIADRLFRSIAVNSSVRGMAVEVLAQERCDGRSIRLAMPRRFRAR